MNRLQLLCAQVADARPLGEALAMRGVQADIVTVDTLCLDFAQRRRMDTVVNLAGAGLDASTRLVVAEALGWLADIGATVVNGLDGFVVASSPARQLALFAHLGLAHPPTRVLGGAAMLPAALEELGLAESQAEVLAGPPKMVRARPEGQPLRLILVGGRVVHGGDLLPEHAAGTVAAAAAEVLGTAGIEFGAVTVASHGDQLWWLSADSAVGTDMMVLDALADYAMFRAGLPAR